MKIKKQLIWYYISLHFWIKDRFEILYLSWRQLSKGFQKIAHFVMGDIFIISAIDSSPWSVFWKIEAVFFPKSDSGVRAVMSWDSGDISVCVLRGLTLETQEPHQKQKRLLTFFSSCFPPSCCHTMMAFSSPPIVYLSLAFHHSWALTDCIACGVQVSRSRFAWVVMIR